MRVAHFISCTLLYLSSYVACGADLQGIPEFIDEMVQKHQFDRDELASAFKQAQILPDVIDSIARPGPTRPWPEYRASFVNRERIVLGVRFWRKYHKALQEAERAYGVPQEIVLAVIGVESMYGKNTGGFRTFDVLTTLAFESPRRSGFFRSELESYLLLAREQKFGLLTVRGSYAGALGIPQFMPSSYRNYGVDFNGNHRIDLMHEARDAIGSVASYLSNSGWIGRAKRLGAYGEQFAEIPPIALHVQVSDEVFAGDVSAPRTLAGWRAIGVKTNLEVERYQDETARMIEFAGPNGKEFWLAFNNFDVITHYNNSDFYAMAVFQLAQALRESLKRDRAM